eukprot:767963-Hanusia_phi.AAC.3
MATRKLGDEMGPLLCQRTPDRRMAESSQGVHSEGNVVSDCLDSLASGNDDHAVNLRGLDLSDEAFENVGQELFVAIGDSERIQVLDLGSSHLDKNAGYHLVQAVQRQKTLSVLRLGNNGLNDTLCANIVHAVGENENLKLKELFLGMNEAGITTGG